MNETQGSYRFIKDKTFDEFFREKTKELTVTIFNTKTYEENQKYRKNNNIKCIYSCSHPLTSIQNDTGVYVLEADISINKIRGIGYIKLNNNKHYCKIIYENQNYNNYAYRGNYHIQREDMNEHEEIIMKVLDQLCFYGKSHLKRYSGIKRFPKKWIYNMSEKTDVLDFITHMFNRRLSK
jgi:hypothetical protein